MQELPETLRKAVEMLARGDLSGGAEFIRSAADRGEVEAIYAMGDLYLKGIGVERSVARALDYFTKAAHQGYSPAMISLSQMYAAGNGVTSDISKAVELCKAAAANGSPEGFTILGIMHENGDYGVTADMKLAADYFQKATDANDAHAPFHLSRLYLSGQGVSKNVELAFQLCEQSANAGSIHGIYGLAHLCETGYEGYKQDLSRANSFYRKAARLGHKEAKDALKRFPPILKMGQIICSPGVFRTLGQPDLRELFERHRSGNWGDVDSFEWDINDRALVEGHMVRSIHQAPHFAVVIQTADDRASTYVEFLNEDYSNQSVDLLASAERAIRLFNLMRTLYSWMQ